MRNTGSCWLILVMVIFIKLASLCRAAHLHFPHNVIISINPLTCWTCLNKTNNDRCNDWAPNVPCYSVEHTMCQTINLVDSRTGFSLAVTKKCARPEQCTEQTIGCHNTHIPGVQECISCCNYNYCNEPVPANHTSALRLSGVLSSAAADRKLSHHQGATVSIIVFVLINVFMDIAQSII